jgi:hypothetical protein
VGWGGGGYARVRRWEIGPIGLIGLIGPIGPIRIPALATTHGNRIATALLFAVVLPLLEDVIEKGGYGWPLVCDDGTFVVDFQHVISPSVVRLAGSRANMSPV